MSRLHPATILVALSLAALSACDKVALLAPTDSTIALSISTTVVPVNGTAQVTASVIEKGGTPVQNGTSVTFTSTFGTIEPVEALTEGGKAVVTFKGSQSGKATIQAFSGSATKTLENILVGGAAAKTAAMRAEPPSLPQAGGTSQVYAVVRDESGNLLPGAPVSFTTDQGTLGSSSAITDANGQAQTSLTTTRAAKVTANIFGGVAATVDITLVSAPTVTIGTCTPATPSVGVAVNCTVTPGAVTATGSPIQNVTVNWGDNTGEQPLGSVTGATVASHTYSAPGTYTVTAAAIDQASQRGTASIALIVQRLLPTISITASAASGSVGVPISFTVTPATTPPQPITGVTVDFGDGGSRDLGAISGATTVLRSYASEGIYTVTATVTDQSGQRGTSSTQVSITRGAGPTITFSQTSSILGSGTTVTAFSVTATVSTGLSVRSIVVTQCSGCVPVYSGTGGTFTVNNIAANSTLTAVATDSAGNQSSSTIIVKSTVP